MRSRGLTVRVAAGVAIATLIAIAAGWLAVDRWLDAPMAIDSSRARVEIPLGQPFSITAAELARQGLLDHPRLFEAYARLRGADARVRAGEYEIPPGTSPRQLLALLESGAVVRHAITIVEGWTFRDLRRALERDPALAQTLAGQDGAAVMRALGEPGLAP